LDLIREEFRKKVKDCCSAIRGKKFYEKSGPIRILRKEKGHERETMD
jgi:hypothetical protein